MTAAGFSFSLAFICSIYAFEFLAWMRWCHHPRHSTLTLPGHTGLHSAASMAAPAGRAAATGSRVHPLAWHPAQEQLWGWCCWPSIEKHHWDRVRVGYGSNIDCCNPPQAIMLQGNDFHIIVLSPALLGRWQPMGSSRQPRQQAGGPGPCCPQVGTAGISPVPAGAGALSAAGGGAWVVSSCWLTPQKGTGPGSPTGESL